MVSNNLFATGWANPPPVAQPAKKAGFTLIFGFAAEKGLIDFNMKNGEWVSR